MSKTISSSLRVLWLSENYFPGRGGMAESCDRIVHALRRAGVTVDLAHLSYRAERPRVDLRHQGRDLICPLGQDPAHALNCLWNLLAKDRLAYTHVVAFGGTLPLLAAPVFAAWLDAPLITLLRGNDFDTAIFAPKRADVLRHALQRSARVCVVSCDKAEKIKALYPHIQPVWIPNGIDLSAWQPLPSSRHKAQSWRGATVQSGRRVLGMFGHIKPKKGGLFFLETLLASGLAEQFHLLFVGELDQEIIAWLQLHQGSVAHSIFPFLDRYELMPHYLACDLVVIASFYDGLPNVLLEAAALAVPLLAAEVGGMKDVLTNGQEAILFYPGDAQDCCQALQRAGALRAEELRILGENSRLMVETRLSLQAETAGYLEVLSSTLRPDRKIDGEADGRARRLEAEGLVKGT